MTPEEHLRRMRQDEVWNLQAPLRPAARRAGTADRAGGRRTQIWATAVVAAAVVAVAGAAITVAPAPGGAPAGPGGAAVASAEPSISVAPSAQPASTPTPTLTTGPSDPSRSAAPVPPQMTPSAGAAEPSAAPAASRAATTHDDRPAFEFVAADRADLARGQRVIACLRDKGVQYVDLAAPDSDGIRYLEFGGIHNDQQSITLGLQYSDACLAAAER